MTPLTDDELREIRDRHKLATASEMTEEIAISQFGYQWWSWIGTPIHGTPGYPGPMRVRQLLSPRQMKLQGWKTELANPECEARPAEGTEPLDYTYRSSGCTVEPLPSLPAIAAKAYGNDVGTLLAEIARLRAEVSRLTNELKSHLELIGRFPPG